MFHHGHGVRVLVLAALALRATTAEQLPTTLPTATTSIYFEGGVNGTLPTQLGLLTALTELFVKDAKLSGTAPSELGALTAMSVLLWSGNDVESSLPSQLGYLNIRDSFDIDSNEHSGTLPTELGNWRSLTHKIDVAYNDLEGLMPTEIGQLGELEDLFKLNNNEFTGELPTQIGNLEKLTGEFLLEVNEFCGDIPNQVEALKPQINEWKVDSGNNFGCNCTDDCDGNNDAKEVLATFLIVLIVLAACCTFGACLAIAVCGLSSSLLACGLMSCCCPRREKDPDNFSLPNEQHGDLEVPHNPIVVATQVVHQQQIQDQHHQPVYTAAVVSK